MTYPLWVSPFHTIPTETAIHFRTHSTSIRRQISPLAIFPKVADHTNHQSNRATPDKNFHLIPVHGANFSGAEKSFDVIGTRKRGR
ncbi:hypothetical protein CEXT_769001 [Caerostris extrusa]|uniref:Uncharacterized protein n=1 Tax=Caerostris extrusa TaxID=172846 RepID=A0AAV4V5H5_CAEEX|nr:hypothetical protein CEXT_769001 [Caerostris extrusa]